MIQDFTIFTEVDAGAKLTVAAAKITAANMLRNEDCYVYKDFGANYFDGLNITFELYISSASATQGIGGMGLTQSTVNDRFQWATGDIYAVGYADTLPTINFGKIGGASDVSINLAYNNLYYCTLKRDAGGDVATLYIYSNSSRTTLVDTLSVAGFGTTKWRYLYGMASTNSGASIRWDGYVQNLELSKRPAAIIF